MPHGCDEATNSDIFFAQRLKSSLDAGKVLCYLYKQSIVRAEKNISVENIRSSTKTCQADEHRRESEDSMEWKHSDRIYGRAYDGDLWKRLR